MMIKYAFADSVELDEALVAGAGLPSAPLAMPKQILERPTNNGAGWTAFGWTFGWLKRRPG